MKSRRRSIVNSARASHRRFAWTAGRALVESKAGVPTMDTVTDQSREPGKAAAAVPYPVERIAEKVPKKRSSNAIDPVKLLNFSQQLYAHALTLQEVIRTEGEVTYDVLRPKCDRQAAQQFEIFYRTGDEPTTEDDFEPAAVGGRST
jgi:hypothetical protein